MATSLAFVLTDSSLDLTDECEGDTAQAVFIDKCVEPVPEAFRGGEVCMLYLDGQAGWSKQNPCAVQNFMRRAGSTSRDFGR